MHVVIFLIAWHIEIRVLNVKTKQSGQFCNTQHVPYDFTQKSSKNESQPVKVDLSKKLVPKQKTIQTFNILEF